MIKLTCAHCRHVWEDDLEGTVAVVGCTRCGKTTPFSVAARPPARRVEDDPSDAPTMMPTSPPPTRGPATRGPATPGPSTPGAATRAPGRPAGGGATAATPPGHVSMPTIAVGSMGAKDDSEAPTIAPGRLPKYEEAPTITGSTPLRGVGGTTAGRAAARTGPPPGSGGVRVEATGGQDPLVGKQLDGYRIEGKLGEGGMGAVYRAHQISLDRDVALKVLPTKYARSAEMVARFTREALSAAQLTHHNIIQVYDVGNDRGMNFITMELVEGESLAEAMRRDGRLQVDDAAGFVLQAARGLQYAHDRGIVHRDIKPANLMLNRQGIVKIADMGLAKRIADRDIVSAETVVDGASGTGGTRAGGTQGAGTRTGGTSVTGTTPIRGGAAAELTQASVAMGTPAYMAPEQGDDAASVDGRADQYSLGCTLYYLCTGRAPFDGTTAQEIISKHKSEPLPPLAQYIQNVPRVFEGLITKMMAKVPEQRFPTLKEVIHELELFLGIDSEKGPYTPREQHLAVLEQQCAAYYAAPTLTKRRTATRGFLIALPVLFLVGIFFALAGDGIGLAGGVLGLGVTTALANFAIQGLKTKDFLFRRLKSAAVGMTLKGWAMAAVGAVLGVVVFWLLGWLFYWMFFAVVGVGLAFAYEKLVAGALRSERAQAVEETREMLKELRLRGVSEEAMQSFVCRFSGDDWEEFFEELFGYEAMIEARARWAGLDKTRTRRKHATWREPLVRWVERIETRRQEAKEQAELARVEKERLKAEGVGEADAEKQASEAARTFQQEQLHKIAAKDVDWSKFQSTGGKRRQLPMYLLPWTVRAAVAGFICYASLLNSEYAGMLPALGPLGEMLEKMYYPLGLGGEFFGLVGGVFALLAAFSRRAMAPWFALSGALLLVLQIPVVEMVNQAQFTYATAGWLGLGLAAGGWGICLLGSLTGDRY